MAARKKKAEKPVTFEQLMRALEEVGARILDEVRSDQSGLAELLEVLRKRVDEHDRLDARLRRLENALDIDVDPRYRAQAYDDRGPVNEMQVTRELPSFSSLTDRAYMMAEELAQIADVVHQHVDRLGGLTDEGEPSVAKPGPELPDERGQLGQLEHALDRVKAQVHRMGRAVPRLERL